MTMTERAAKAGSESFRPPRYGTPRNLDRRTLGPAIGEIARRLRSPFLPHQQHVIDVAYELDDDGQLWYQEADVSLGRQQGKTFLVIAKKIARCTAIASYLREPQNATYTAQTGKKARQRWDNDMVGVLDRSRWFHEKRNPKKVTDYRVRRTNGSEAITFGRGSRLGIEAPAKEGASATAGHGDTLDDGTIDEALSREDDTQEQSMLPTMMTRQSPQLWVVSSAGFVNSFYWWRKILAGRALVESGEDSRLCFFEWSAPDDMPYDDERTWELAMPGLDIMVPRSFVRARLEAAKRGEQVDEETKGSGVDAFRRAFLNQWPEIPPLENLSDRKLSPEQWYAVQDDGSKRDPRGALVLGFDVHNGWSSITAVGTRVDGLPHIEVIKHEQGTAWLAPELMRLAERHDTERRPIAVWFDGSNASLSMLPELERHGWKVQDDDTRRGKWPPLRKLVGRPLFAASELFVTAVKQHQLRHPGQPIMGAAVDNARSLKSSDSWRFSREMSLGDVTPLIAGVAAHWGYRQRRIIAVGGSTKKQNEAANDLFARNRERLKL